MSNKIQDAFKELSLAQITTQWPLLSGNLVNAFYSSLILKKLSGVQIDLNVERETLDDVFSKWNAVVQQLLKGIASTKDPLGPV